jgi:micrococcal nuclease
MKKQIFLSILFFILSPVSHSFSADLNPLLASSLKYENIRVARVLSADRILLENEEKISLIGIKGPRAPKMKDVKRDEHGFIIRDEDPTTPFEMEAVGFVRSLAEGKPVRLEFDVQRRADNGDILAYVILPDARLLNAEILRYGYANLRLVPPNMKYADKLRTAYQEARREMRGMSSE